MSETAYLPEVPSGHRIDHDYGPRVHVLADAWSLSLLERLSHPASTTREVLPLIDATAHRLLHAASEQLPTRVVHAPTRMTATEPRAVFRGRTLDPHAQVVVVDVARGGILPSALFQRQLLLVCEPSQVRVDHVYAQRVAHPHTGEVTGVHFAGSKVGGPVEGATLLLPDPMAATGSSVDQVLAYYRDEVQGTPRRVVLCHLMATPEYLARITAAWPEAVIYTLRVDRGLSPDAVLAARLGELAGERGLTDASYIVPGAGGVGEVINNSYV